MYGRRVVYSSTLAIALIFLIPCAVAKNIETLLISRAISGLGFSAPMCLVGGTLADIWRPQERGLAMAMFSAAPFLGPVIGPLAGGYLGDAAGWRWLYWLQLILGGISWVMITLVPETYAPTVLARKAAKLRKETGDQRYTSTLHVRTESFSEYLASYLLRPFRLLFTELIVFLMSFYMSILYGILYMFFVSFPIIYQEGKGYSSGKTGLMFIPIAVGCIFGLAATPALNKDYLKQRSRYEGMPPAEIRLRGMMIGCWFIPMGLFISAWTSYPQLSWAGPAMGGLPVGVGIVFIYNSANNYIVDSYQHLAASALAAKTFIRSLYGAAVVLFCSYMYRGMGNQWAGTLVALLALVCCPIPFLFFWYGARIRKRSKYAYSGEEQE
jgi:multidrug resistance protein